MNYWIILATLRSCLPMICSWIQKKLNAFYPIMGHSFLKAVATENLQKTLHPMEKLIHYSAPTLSAQKEEHNKNLKIPSMKHIHMYILNPHSNHKIFRPLGIQSDENKKKLSTMLILDTQNRETNGQWYNYHTLATINLSWNITTFV